MNDHCTKLPTVDKNLLAKRISRRIATSISDAEHILEVVEDEIIDAVKANEKVQLNGFLTFVPKDVDGKVMYSPLDKKEYVIESKRTVLVKVGKLFKDSIKDAYKGKTEEPEDAHPKKQSRSRKPKT